MALAKALIPLRLVCEDEAVLDDDGAAIAEEADVMDASEEGIGSALDVLREVEVLNKRPLLSEDLGLLDGLRGPAPNAIVESPS